MPDPKDNTPPALGQPSISLQLPSQEKPALGKPEPVVEPELPTLDMKSTARPIGGQSMQPDPTLSMEKEKPFVPPPPPPRYAPPPPPPASTSAASQTTPPPAESPQVMPPKRSGNIKKIFMIAAAAIGLSALAFLIVRVVLPRIQSIKVPGLPGKEIALTYWGLWEPNAVMQDVIDEYVLDHPNVKIEYVQQSHKDYRERLQSALAKGEGPDIFRFHNTWVPMLNDDLDAVPADVYSASDFQETFYPTAARDLRRGASFVGIPLETDGLALFYNKEIFKTAGKIPPTTWEDLRKTAFDLTIRDSQGRIQRAGVALGTTGNVDHWPDILGLMMLQNGANLSDPTDKLAADALLFYTIFVRSDKVWDATLPGSTQAFASGDVAMYFGPSWRVLDIKALNPDLDFAVIPVPQLPKSDIAWASYWVEGVSAQSENTKDAWEFLKFLSSKETLEKFYAAAVKSGRMIGEPYSRKDMRELLADDPAAGAYVNQASNAQSWYLSSLTHDNGINDRIIKYFEDAVNAVNQRTDPEQALSAAAEGISQVLTQYGIK